MVLPAGILEEVLVGNLANNKKGWLLIILERSSFLFQFDNGKINGSKYNSS